MRKRLPENCFTEPERGARSAGGGRPVRLDFLQSEDLTQAPNGPGRTVTKFTICKELLKQP